MSGIRFAEVRARVTMAEVLGLVGFVPCETSGDQVRGPCPVHHSRVTLGAQLLRKSTIAYLQMLQMRVLWESPGPVRRSDRPEPLRGRHRAVRAARP